MYPARALHPCLTLPTICITLPLPSVRCHDPPPLFAPATPVSPHYLPCHPFPTLEHACSRLRSPATTLPPSPLPHPCPCRLPSLARRPSSPFPPCHTPILALSGATTLHSFPTLPQPCHCLLSSATTLHSFCTLIHPFPAFCSLPQPLTSV